MKTNHIVLTALVCVIVLAAIVYKHGDFKGSAEQIGKIAAEQENTLVKVENLTKEIEGLKTDLNTLKSGGKDYAKEIQEIARKQAQLRLEPGQSGAGLKVAVISIRRIFQESRKGVSYREEAIAEQDRIVAELDKLSKEIEAEKAGLKTLKENSSDYMASAKGLFERQANYQARQEFYKQQMELKDQLWMKELYQDILQIAGEIAKEKELDLVFKEDEVDFSDPDVSSLGMAISTQKLLYSGGCLDITDEVKTRLDAEK
jgi:Skp family chaperone for outer membrane proteins